MYTIVFHDNGKMEALRCDEYEWRDLTGDTLVYWLAVELQEARKEITRLKEEYEDFDAEWANK